MIVCICRAKNEREVLRAMDAGAETLGELKACGIGTDCGGCHDVLRRMLTANAGAPPAALYAAAFSVSSCVEDVA